MEHPMNETIDAVPEVRDLTLAEVSAISGGFNNMGPLMAAGAAVLRFIDDINLQLHGCFDQGGRTVCVYSHDL
jgi:hypothetical protein